MPDIEIVIDRPFQRKRCPECDATSTYGSPCCDGRGWVYRAIDDRDRLSRRMLRASPITRRIPLQYTMVQGKPASDNWAHCIVLGFANLQPGAAFGVTKYGGINADEIAAVKMALDVRDKRLFDEGPFPHRRVSNLPSEAKLKRAVEFYERKRGQTTETVSRLEMPTGFDWE